MSSIPDDPRRAADLSASHPGWTPPAGPSGARRPHAPQLPLWALVRLVEATFPPDGFAEATQLAGACDAGRVRDVGDLSRFLDEAIRAAGTSSVPFVQATAARPVAHAAVDVACDVSLTGRRERDASSEKGRAFLAGAAAFSPAAARLLADARGGQLAGHLAPAFGAVLGLLGCDAEEACRLFLYLGARGIVAEAVRVGIVGPLGGYEVLTAATPALRAVLAHGCGPGRADGPSTGGAGADGAPADGRTEPRPATGSVPPIRRTRHRIDYA